MIDTSPDGDSFSTLWKFLTKAASQLKTSSPYNHRGCGATPKLLGLEPGRACEQLRMTQKTRAVLTSPLYSFSFFLRILSLSPKPAAASPQRGHVIL